MRSRRDRETRRFVLAVARAFERIETERLVLRQLTPTDAGAFAATIDAVVIEANGWTDEQAHATPPEVAAGRWSRRRLFTRAVMTNRATGVVLGSISARGCDATERSCEIGWWTGPAARGQGYATEAAIAIVDALHAAGVRRVWIGTASGNTAVQRTAVRTGARLVGERPHQLPNGVVVPSLWYAHDVDHPTAAGQTNDGAGVPDASMR